MSFDQSEYHKPAITGDVGYTTFLAMHAIEALSLAIRRLAEKSGVAVEGELETVREDIERLNAGFQKLTGWKGE